MTTAAAPYAVEESGRLAPVEALVRAVRDGAADLAPLIERCFPRGMRIPPGWRQRLAAVWHDTCVWAPTCNEQPILSFDGGAPVPLAEVRGSPYWVAAAPVEPGRLHTARLLLDGEWSVPVDVPGYGPLSYELPGVARGTISPERSVASRVYAGATTSYWLYASDGVDEVRGAPVMIWQDGERRLEPHDLLALRLQIVSDNLVHRGVIPPLVHVFVAPSRGGRGANLRGLQYATFSDRYGRHLLEEVLPDAEREVKLRRDAYSRGAAGTSAGGVAAFKLAWLQPEEFSRVQSTVGSFTGVQARQVRRVPPRNVRVWLASGTNDTESERGSLPLANIDLANALKLRGYDFHLHFGEGHHGSAPAAVALPDSLAWLWRGYDPERTDEVFEQEESERAQPVFRVRIANRDASSSSGLDV